MRKDFESEIVDMLRERELTVAFLTRFLTERGFDVTRQRVERTLRKLVSMGLVEARVGNNGRKHYRLAR
ncbi:helix-turn-helix domain-containing protein [Thermococcus henrietii]|uniref:helix-turn-helix domain-containing protein n=1 Tax=Thermococcus henrietii TaxID=2016361 RepID=UPI000C0884AC|nr:helix-turn-helix domain-containing protein [Thermococcus henrietii]